MQVWGGVNKPNPTGQKGIFQINLNAEFSSMLGEGGLKQDHHPYVLSISPKCINPIRAGSGA